MSTFPRVRPRRLRRTAALRSLFQETSLRPGQLVLPLFVSSGRAQRTPVESMPGVAQTSPDETVADAQRAREAGIGGVLLFGIPDTKDAEGSSAWDPQGPVQQAVAGIKAQVPEIVCVTDVCMCEYTDHGHCGILRDGQVDNDATLELLARVSLSHARAGADIVAPSDMMDGRVGAIRRGLDDGGYEQTAIMSYAVKYASAFYGPFRDAAGSAPQSGDRRGYQMHGANRREAQLEAALDTAEGADVLMVKPAGPYLDIIADVRSHSTLPLAAYQVSGEFAMIRAAAARGWLDERAVMLESLMSIRRAGADLIITYFAVEAARELS